MARAVASGPTVRTSQIALPKAVCQKVYATSGYAGSARNLAQTSLSTDLVFGDDKAIHQLATVTCDVPAFGPERTLVYDPAGHSLRR